MSFRTRLGRFFLILGSYLESLPVVVMKPDDLIEFGRLVYKKMQYIDQFSDNALIDEGLSPEEEDLFHSIQIKSGELLLLGVGGGREAVFFAQQGFNVTGIDFVEEMVARTIENANQRALNIQGLVQEFSKLNLTADTYDVIWFSRSMYSGVPTRKRRVEMLRILIQALRPGGVFVCQFHRDRKVIPSKRGVFIRRLIALITLGNLEYEPGDILWGNVEFLHAFSSEIEVRDELKEAGFVVENPVGEDVSMRGSVVTTKRRTDE